MRLEWDEDKRVANFGKHRLAFEDVELVFVGNVVTFEDDRVDYGERRLISLGQLEGRTVVVVHSARVDSTRIISFRKANSREQQIYQERLGEDRQP